MSFTDDCLKLVAWLEGRVVADARASDLSEMPTEPSKSVWLGRLAPEEAAWKAGKGERVQRLDPCAVGMIIRPATWNWHVEVRFVVWEPSGKAGDRVWKKSEPVEVAFDTGEIDPDSKGQISVGSEAFRLALDARGLQDRSGRIDIEIDHEHGAPMASVVVVNDTPEKARLFDANFYELVLRLRIGQTQPILLDALPDSFRYDRKVEAFGINGGVRQVGEWLETTDVVDADRRRPQYWDTTIGEEPDFTFAKLSDDPLPSVEQLVLALDRWGDEHWSSERLQARRDDEHWSDEMSAEAAAEAERFGVEVQRLRDGVKKLQEDDKALAAFKMMNDGFRHSGRRNGYDRWRPFQLGFLLTVLPSLTDDSDSCAELVDTLWFATGGGKTETYLAAVVFRCLLDRLSGKGQGISAWSRFPLRMLSLQQTQRFADALAGAELARQRAELAGDPFAVGFLVGGPPNGTPNRIRDDATDNETDAGTMVPDQHRVLLHCPFCFSEDLQMTFNRRAWRLEHRCTSDACAWKLEPALPFLIVDEEIYRFLPCVIIGTLDKAASIALQAAMRGVYASPIAVCSRDGHGFSYAPRSRAPKGCLVPGCDSPTTPLAQDLSVFAPSLRVQDELHLLRDSLGAVDAHYETLLDHVQARTKSHPAKIIASSATLSGYERQVRILYARDGSVFPLQGPAPGASFWTKDGDLLARRFVGLAPRGQTLEFANDRLAESLQRGIRLLITDPARVCEKAGIAAESVGALIDQYGTHVCYGTRIADVDAAARSFETQPGVEPLNVRRLTGQTELSEVREVLGRVSRPEPNFEDRLHIICASSMMSHGVDIPRFNVFTLLGIPLATAEFIQTTARIGRFYPGLVFVLHRMGVERDASVFRTFVPFVEQGDRFIEPIAITRRSRRVLEHTFPGAFSTRVLGIHEAKRVRTEGKNISTARELRAYASTGQIQEGKEDLELADAFRLRAGQDSALLTELSRQVRLTFQEINNFASKARFVSELLPRPPMRSLREVESQVVIRSKGDQA